METRIFYRADKRDFSPGDLMESAGEFLAKNPAGSGDIEEVFEEKRPRSLPSRAVCLYVFESLKDAKKHWSKMIGGKLYEVTVAVPDILHRADMSLIDTAFINQHAPTTVATYARQYWSGECGTKPVIEILVKKAQASKIISNSEQERIAYLKSWAMPDCTQQGAKVDGSSSDGSAV